MWPTERGQTHRQTHARTDKRVKTERHMILSNDIFWFKTVIIGGPNIMVQNEISVLQTIFIPIKLN